MTRRAPGRALGRVVQLTSALPKILSGSGTATVEISLARFKKRRSEPTRGRGGDPGPGAPKDGAAGPGAPKDGAAGPAKDPEQPPAPPTEPPAGGARPPAEPQVTPEQQGEKERKLNRLFWMRVGFAVAAGVAATFVFEPVEGEERRWASIGFMIVVFIVTIIIGKGMRIPFSLSDRKKIVTQGIGSYIFMYLFVWIMSYTLVNLGSMEQSSQAIPFP